MNERIIERYLFLDMIGKLEGNCTSTHVDFSRLGALARYHSIFVEFA